MEFRMPFVCIDLSENVGVRPTGDSVMSDDELLSAIGSAFMVLAATEALLDNGVADSDGSYTIHPVTGRAVTYDEIRRHCRGVVIEAALMLGERWGSWARAGAGSDHG